MLANLPEIEKLLLQNPLKKRPLLLFIRVNLCKSNLTKIMIGHKLGEFSNEKIGAKIMIHQEIKRKKIKINTNNDGSSG